DACIRLMNCSKQ
ncbi:thiF family protein, partial [Vibrio parahaemolyticus V-223/04]